MERVVTGSSSSNLALSEDISCICIISASCLIAHLPCYTLSVVGIGHRSCITIIYIASSLDLEAVGCACL